VRSRREFLAIQRGGRRLAAGHFLLVHTERDQGIARLGITVSKKIGHAVVRNRVKRSVREVFRRCRNDLGPGLRVVVIAREGAGELSFHQVAAELAPALRDLRDRRKAPRERARRDLPGEVR